MIEIHNPGIIKGFTPLKTHHCVTGSMRDIYGFNGHPISEEMLFGLGNGIGFVYWHPKGAAPFLGGRGNTGRKGEEGIEITSAKRTGVGLLRFETSSDKKAEDRMLAMLQAGEPVMFYADMGFLPYCQLPPGVHFGAHMVVAAGYDPQTFQVFVSDRDGLLHPVLLSDVRQARSSKFQPFPPKNVWFEFDFPEARLPKAEEIRQAILETSKKMVKPPITNIGVKGIYRAAQRVPLWSEVMDESILREACLNGYIYIDATGGTGGGLFRYMYSRFLNEAINSTGVTALEETSIAFNNIGDRWQEVALLFKESSSLKNPENSLKTIGEKLYTIAGLEKTAWEQLYKIVQK